MNQNVEEEKLIDKTVYPLVLVFHEKSLHNDIFIF